MPASNDKSKPDAKAKAAKVLPRRKMILAPFRGVPALRGRVEQALARAIRLMQEQAQAEALRDGVTARWKAERLQGLLKQWSGRFDKLAEELSHRMVADTSQAAKDYFVSRAAKAMGVDALAVYDVPGMHDVLDDAAVAAATYIKTIPNQYLGKVAGAVAQTVRAEALPDGQSLPQYLMQLGDLTVKRSKFLARDQYAKVTSTVAEHQQRSIGVEEYVWSSSRDGRVVGNPIGLYPNGTRQHGDHFHRDGKVYRWDKPPHDGPPGTAPGCRCIALPVIDPVKILGLEQRTMNADPAWQEAKHPRATDGRFGSVAGDHPGHTEPQGAPVISPQPSPAQAKVPDKAHALIAGKDAPEEYVHGTTMVSVRAFLAGKPPERTQKTMSEFGNVLYLSEKTAPHQALMFGQQGGAGYGGRAMIAIKLKPGTPILNVAPEARRVAPLGYGKENRYAIEFKDRPSWTDDMAKWLNEARAKRGKEPLPADRVTNVVDPTAEQFAPEQYPYLLAQYAADRGYGALRFADETIVVNTAALSGARKLAKKEVEQLKATPQAYPRHGLFAAQFGNARPTGR